MTPEQAFEAGRRSGKSVMLMAYMNAMMWKAQRRAKRRMWIKTPKRPWRGRRSRP